MDQSHEVSGNPQPFATPSTLLTDFRHLERYPWSADPNFQAGLSSIVASHGVGLNSPELEQLVVTARRFYFLRYVINHAPRRALLTQHLQDVQHQRRPYSLPDMACVSTSHRPLATLT